MIDTHGCGNCGLFKAAGETEENHVELLGEYWAEFRLRTNCGLHGAVKHAVFSLQTALQG
jgi:hypothetical protein